VAAGKALEARNAILHSTPALAITRPQDLLDGTGREVLSFVPKKGTGPHVMTPLTGGELSKVTAQLVAAREGWTDLATALWESRSARRTEDPDGAGGGR
jgi:hypothetical protein